MKSYISKFLFDFFIISLMIVGSVKIVSAQAIETEPLKLSGQSTPLNLETGSTQGKTQKASSLPDSAKVISEIEAEVIEDNVLDEDAVPYSKPLDLTFNPVFTENPLPYLKEGGVESELFSGLIGNKSKKRKVRLRGEFIKPEVEEREKMQAVDGAGIRIELNPI